MGVISVDAELVKTLAENVSVMLVLGYWIVSERKSHRETLLYYRDEINDRIDRLEKKIDDITLKLM